MQIGLLQKLLSSFAALAESLGSASAARELSDLRRLFVGSEKTMVVKFLDGLRKNRPAQDCRPMSESVRRLSDTLMKFEETLSLAKSKSAVDIKLLVGFLTECHHSSISELVADVQTWRPKPKLGRASSPLHREVVETYLDELRRLESNNAAFDQAVSKLKNDKKVRVAEMREIASQYLGYRIAKDKNKAWQAIVDQQAFNARQIARSQNQV